jgi:hypothetical protein
MLAPLVAAFCTTTSTPGSYRAACNKTYEAVSAKFGIDQELDGFASHYAQIGERAVKERVDEQTLAVMAATFATLSNRQIKYSTSAIPYVQTTVVTVWTNQIGVRFIWSL